MLLWRLESVSQNNKNPASDTLLLGRACGFSALVKSFPVNGNRGCGVFFSLERLEDCLGICGMPRRASSFLPPMVLRLQYMFSISEPYDFDARLLNSKSPPPPDRLFLTKRINRMFLRSEGPGGFVFFAPNGQGVFFR